MYHVPIVGVGQIALSLFRMTKLGNWTFLLLLFAKGHRSQETDEVIDSRTQTRFVAEVRTMLVLLTPVQYLDSRPSSPHSLPKLEFILKQFPLFVLPFWDPKQISAFRRKEEGWRLWDQPCLRLWDKVQTQWSHLLSRRAWMRNKLEWARQQVPWEEVALKTTTVYIN